MAETAGMLLTILMLVVAVTAVVVVIVAVYAKAPLEKKYQSSGGGLGGSFDAIWMPSAHEAGMERDRQTQRTAPAPSPGDQPSRIDGERIILDI
jgi:hypothetical protein